MIVSILNSVTEEPPNGPSGPRAEWRVNSRLQAGNCAGAALPTPSIQIRKGGGRLRRPEPKTKGHPKGCPFVLKGTVKIDIFPFLRKAARRAAHQLRAQRSGSQLERRSKGAGGRRFFAAGIKKRRSKADFAPTWKGWLKSIFLYEQINRRAAADPNRSPA